MITYWYWRGKVNAGDYFNEYLIHKIYTNVQFSEVDPDIVMCGSVIENPKVKNAKYIIGCGSQENIQPVNHNSKSYLCIRGNKTKDLLVRTNILTQEESNKLELIDPGLLLSYFYKPINKIKTHKIGIIPHYVDEKIITEIYKNNNNIKLISIQTKNIEKLAEQICCCDIIISSSLHGIIFSHSLGIPAYYCQCNKLSGEIGFKFDDYYSSFGLICKHFKWNNNYTIPINEIIEFDKKNRYMVNPSIDMVKLKQKKIFTDIAI